MQYHPFQSTPHPQVEPLSEHEGDIKSILISTCPEINQLILGQHQIE